MRCRLYFFTFTVMFMALLVVNLTAPASVSATGESCQDPEALGRWAVILSPGPETGVPWGGYHVTIAGYSNMHACSCDDDTAYICVSPLCSCCDNEAILRKYFKSLFNDKPWHLHGDLPALLEWSGIWTQTFQSEILDTLANKLEVEGFEKIKGPDHPTSPGKKGTPWHITLTADKTFSKATVAAFKREKTDWYLWLVPAAPQECIDHGTNCPTWTRIDPL
jgi:hypothetical protein